MGVAAQEQLVRIALHAVCCCARVGSVRVAGCLGACLQVGKQPHLELRLQQIEQQAQAQEQSPQQRQRKQQPEQQQEQASDWQPEPDQQILSPEP